jgi:glycosyltransferase involved in cell wall biosynthesis
VLEPKFFEQLQLRVEALQLEDHIHFCGKATDLQSYFAGIGIFVLPSRSEGFSNALIEAMAAGLPCIATDVGGNGEAIQHGRNGLLVPADDRDALANAIEELLGNPAAASRLGEAARRTAEERFSAEAMMRKVAALYSALLERA